jgi:endo-1,3(4)-beta-glucanase
VNNAPWADVHYTVNSGLQQNIRMSHDAANNNYYTLNGIPSGAVVRYFFTIGLSTGATDTAWKQFTCCSASASSHHGAFAMTLRRREAVDRRLRA